jgi:hypothetical protein
MPSKAGLSTFVTDGNLAERDKAAANHATDFEAPPKFSRW